MYIEKIVLQDGTELTPKFSEGRGCNGCHFELKQEQCGALCDPVRYNNNAVILVPQEAGVDAHP